MAEAAAAAAAAAFPPGAPPRAASVLRGACPGASRWCRGGWGRLGPPRRAAPTLPSRHRGPRLAPSGRAAPRRGRGARAAAPRGCVPRRRPAGRRGVARRCALSPGLRPRPRFVPLGPRGGVLRGRRRRASVARRGRLVAVRRTGGSGAERSGSRRCGWRRVVGQGALTVAAGRPPGFFGPARLTTDRPAAAAAAPLYPPPRHDDASGLGPASRARAASPLAARPSRATSPARAPVPVPSASLLPSALPPSRPNPVFGRGWVGRLRGRGTGRSTAVRRLAGARPLSLRPALSRFAGTFSVPSEPRPQIRRGDPLNLSILVSGGKETNQDSLSNGE